MRMFKYLKESGYQIDLSNKNNNNKDGEKETQTVFLLSTFNCFSFTYSPSRRFNSYSNED